MDWLTIEEIMARSKTAEGALKVSYEIWNQRYQATAKEYRQAIKDRKIEFGCVYCGLCLFYHPYCGNCPLSKSGMACRIPKSPYHQAWRASDKWRIESKVRNWWVWKRAAKALRDKLKELMEIEPESVQG